MKIQIGLLYVCNEALNRLYVQPLSPVDSFRVSNIITPCLLAVQRFDALRLDLCKKYGNLNKDGSGYDFSIPENFTKFQEELDLLSKEEVELDVVPIMLKSLDKADVRISPVDVLNLKWLIQSDSVDKNSKGE